MSASPYGHSGANTPDKESAPFAGGASGAAAGSSKKKWILMAVAAVVVVAVVVGTAVGVTVGKHKHHVDTASSGGSGSGSSSGGDSGSGNSTDGNDPSVFDKDPNLRKVFYGIAYTPIGSIAPECGANQDDIIKDIQLMSQLTDTIRLYGAGCNVSALVLNAIALTKVDMKVFLANYIDTSNDTSFQTQKTAIEDALTTYGADHVLGVTVGNEVMLNACLDAGVSDPNDAAVKPAADYIITCIQATRTGLSSLGHGDLKVGNGDAGSYFATTVLEASDFGLANDHPWFAHEPVDQAAQWTWNFFNETNVTPAAALANKPDMYIAEIGWPTNSSSAEAESDGAAGTAGDASVANLQAFMDSWVCQSNEMGIKYFFFELFDEKWKDVLYGGVEGWWGIMYANKTLKEGLTLPTCTIST